MKERAWKEKNKEVGRGPTEGRDDVATAAGKAAGLRGRDTEDGRTEGDVTDARAKVTAAASDEDEMISEEVDGWQQRDLVLLKK